MASVTTDRAEYECPVCHEDLTQPKLLPCAHLLCRKCVLSWLQKEGGEGTCPLCRVPILSPTKPPSQGDLETRVDALPTDMATAALVESHKILRTPHVCTICRNNVTATSYCLECKMKLCSTCTVSHKQFPALQIHALEDLDTLTEKKMAANYRATCKTHPDETAKLYCLVHGELICMLCANTSSHWGCAGKKTVGDVATEKRKELKQQVQRLKEKEKAISTQIKEAKDKFEDMRRIAKDTFDDLQQCVEKRRQEVSKLIQAHEDASMTSLMELERFRTALASNSASVEKLVDSAPAGALLGMLNSLASRLSDLESQSGTKAGLKMENLYVGTQRLNESTEGCYRHPRTDRQSQKGGTGSLSEGWGQGHTGSRLGQKWLYR